MLDAGKGKIGESRFAKEDLSLILVSKYTEAIDWVPIG
jgi:hypothetical protein